MLDLNSYIPALDFKHLNEEIEFSGIDIDTDINFDLSNQVMKIYDRLLYEVWNYKYNVIRDCIATQSNRKILDKFDENVSIYVNYIDSSFDSQDSELLEALNSFNYNHKNCSEIIKILKKD